MRLLLRSLIVIALANVALRLDGATVTTLDGLTLTGDGVTFDGRDGAVRIGAERVPLADCDRIEPGDGAGLPVPPGKRLGLWLVDGGWMPATVIDAADADDTLAISGPLGALRLPLGAVAGWGLGDLPGQAGKADQVLLASGVQSGQVLGIGPASPASASAPPDASGGRKLWFTTGAGEPPLGLGLGDVHGLRLAVPMKPPKGISFSAVLDGSRAPLRLVVAPGGGGPRPADAALVLAAAPEVALGGAVLPMRLVVDGGRRIHLADLRPDTVEETGAFGVVWPWRRDATFDGGPLRLGGVRQVRGIAVHSQARLTWKLGGTYTRMHALVGISDAVGPEGDCAVAIVGDGRALWSRPSVKGGEQPQIVALDLSGVQRLELEVGFGARYDIGDHLVLGDAWLVKRK